jgi:hypothetical protein
MTQREIFQLVELTADNLPEANELFSSGCGRKNEIKDTAEIVGIRFKAPGYTASTSNWTSRSVLC